jgi:hypothetical protein
MAPYLPPGEITFFANGVDGRVWMVTPSTGWVPTGWVCTGHLAAATVVSTVNSGTAFACRGGDGAIWLATDYGSGWTTFSLGSTGVEGPGLAFAPNSLTVVAEGADQQLWQDTATAMNPTSAASFGGWVASGGILTAGATAAALLYSNANP